MKCRLEAIKAKNKELKFAPSLKTGKTRAFCFTLGYQALTYLQKLNSNCQKSLTRRAF